MNHKQTFYILDTSLFKSEYFIELVNQTNEKQTPVPNQHTIVGETKTNATHNKKEM